MKTLAISLSVFFLAACTVGTQKANDIQEVKQDTTVPQPIAASSKTDSVGEQIVPERSQKDTVLKKANSNQPLTYGLTVSFYSIGEGIESAQVEKFEHFLSSFRQKSGKGIPSEKVSWGREGERDYCLNLSELSASDKTKFIQDVKEELKSAKLVHFSENSPCKQKRR